MDLISQMEKNNNARQAENIGAASARTDAGEEGNDNLGERLTLCMTEKCLHCSHKAKYN
jgi:hypothetical protein